MKMNYAKFDSINENLNSLFDITYQNSTITVPAVQNWWHSTSLDYLSADGYQKEDAKPTSSFKNA